VVWIPIFMSIFITSSVLMLGKIIYKNWHKSALLTFLIFIIFFNYGRVSPTFPEFNLETPIIPIGTDLVAIISSGLVVLLVAWLLRTTETIKFQTLNHTFNAITLFLISLSIFLIAPLELS